MPRRDWWFSARPSYPFRCPTPRPRTEQLEALSANTTIDNGAFIQITSVSNPGHQGQGWGIYDNGPGAQGQAGVLSNCLRNAISHLELPGSWCFTGRQLPAQPLATDQYVPSRPLIRFSRRPIQGLSEAKVRKRHS